MQHIVSQNYLSSNQYIRVNLDTQVNVKLMDYHNYSQYKQGKRHIYYGGLAAGREVNLKPPCAGTWYLVIDQQGYKPQQFRYGIQVVSSN